MSNSNRTSKKVASIAGATLSKDNSSAIQKSLAGSALAQSKTNKSTSKKMETKASAALKDERSNETTKMLAGSVVSQSNKTP